MLALRLARVNLFEMGLHALIRIAKEKRSPQAEAELAAFFHLRRLGSTVLARNWKSGRASGTVELVAWEGGTLCFVKVSLDHRGWAPREKGRAILLLCP